MSNNYQSIQDGLQREIHENMEILRNNPDYIPALGHIGDAYMKLNRPEEATKAYQRIISIDSNNVSGFIALATVYVLTGKLDDAINTAHRALDISPGNVHVLGIAAAIHERCRESGKILELLKPEIDSGNRNPAIVLPYANALSDSGEIASAVTLLEESLNHAENAGDYLISTQYLLGKLHDKLSDYDGAFKYFDKANQLGYVYFDTSRPTLEQEAIRSRFTSEFMEARELTGIKTERPVFIVGMPRSGTTLVDRIISSHPEAASAGELAALPSLVETMCQSFELKSGHFTNCADTINSEQISAMANQYLNILEKEHPSATRITDKMPVNFMYLGMIQILFPDARIINCIRSPADLCLSCYIQNFHGAKPYLNKLEEIAMVYRNYRILMEHWQSVLSLSIYNVEYETIVTSPEDEIRKLIDFVDLPWDERCLRFHQEGQYINTASYDQVDKPIYQSSIGRWKHYEKHLDSLKTSLGEYWPN